MTGERVAGRVKKVTDLVAEKAERRIQRLLNPRASIQIADGLSFKVVPPSDTGNIGGSSYPGGGGGIIAAIRYVRKNSGGTVFQRTRINLIEGTNITLTVADDSVNDEIDVTIAAASGGITGSGTNHHIMRWDGTGAAQDSSWQISDSGDVSYNNGSSIAFLFDGAIGALIAYGPATNFLLQGYVYGDTGDARFTVLHDGTLRWSTGAAGTFDVQLSRLAANVLSLAAGDVLNITGQGGDNASTTQGNVSYDTTTDKFRFSENGSYVYGDNGSPIVLVGDAAVTIAATDRTIVFRTALSIKRAATLPALSAVPDGTRICIKDLGGINGANTIDLTPNGTDKIETANAVYPITVALSSIIVQKISTALGWAVI